MAIEVISDNNSIPGMTRIKQIPATGIFILIQWLPVDHRWVKDAAVRVYYRRVKNEQAEGDFFVI